MTAPMEPNLLAKNDKNYLSDLAHNILRYL
jgi:hypothetical protein